MDVTSQILLKETDVPGARLTQDPKQCNVDVLKRWLECHGLKKSGKKDELVRRVEDALKLDLQVDPKVDGGKWYNLKASSSSSTTQDSNYQQPNIPVDGWKQFPSKNLPVNFNYGHVYFYLVESLDKNILQEDDESNDDEAIDTDTVTSKSLRKGRMLLKSGFVEDIQDNENDQLTEFIVRAHVHHSMKNELPLNVTVILSNVSGYVKSCYCDCKASAIGRCAHVAALLLHLSDLSASKENIIVPSTSQPCTWNKGKKRCKTPKPLHLASYPSSKRKPPSNLYNWDPRPEETRGSTPDRAVLNSFISSISGENLTMWETLIKRNYEDFSLDEQEISLLRQNCTIFICELQKHNELILQEKDCCEIPGTMEQSKSDTWHQERKFRITASICKTVVNMGEHLSSHDSLQPHFHWLERNFWFPSSFTTVHMRYGIENEEEAIKEYVTTKQVSVARSGLWINKKYVHLAASPDGLIFDSCSNLVSIVEIKCLKILKLHSVEDVLLNNCPRNELKRQCFDVKGAKLVLKRSHSYFYQVQLQLLITEASYCDFVLYSSKGPSHIERIFPDPELHIRIINKTRLFWEKVFIPEYFQMRVPRELLPMVM